MAKTKKKAAPAKKATKPKTAAKRKAAPAPTAPRRRQGHDCPRGKCCLWRLGLRGEGEIKFELGDPYPCPMGETASGSGSMELKVQSSGPPCDEPHGLIPNGSKLIAAIHPIRRGDDLAYICGTFTIVDPHQTPLFVGDVDLLHRVNTHHQPFGNDPCDRRDHLQGWLVGMGTENGRSRGFLLRAMLVARTDPLDGGTRGYALRAVNINGVLIRCSG